MTDNRTLTNHNVNKGKNKRIINKIVKQINYVIMILSVMMLVFGTLSNISHRVPVISYMASELGVPYTLRMRGTVYAVDSGGNKEIMINPIVTIGGFYAEVDKNGEYSLTFLSSSNRKKVPVTITYCNAKGKEFFYHDEVNFNGEYELVSDFNVKMEE